MLLANGFGQTEWEGLKLNGLAGGHTFMTSFYKKGVLVNEEQDPVIQRYQAALVQRLGSERAAAVLRGILIHGQRAAPAVPTAPIAPAAAPAEPGA